MRNIDLWVRGCYVFAHFMYNKILLLPFDFNKLKAALEGIFVFASWFFYNICMPLGFFLVICIIIILINQ
jgi:hypothetical protein